MQKFELNFSSCSVYGCGTWSLASRDQQRLRVYENSVLKTGLGVRWKVLQEGRANCIKVSFMICNL